MKPNAFCLDAKGETPMPTKRALPVLRPERIRHVPRSFAWLDHRLRSDGWLSRLPPTEISLYIFLALAADARGLSCWRLDRIERELPGWDLARLRTARERLIVEGLIAFRPWTSSSIDGCYQLLSMPERITPARDRGPQPLSDCLTNWKAR
jgi:hypothetical protein